MLILSRKINFLHSYLLSKFYGYRSILMKPLSARLLHRFVEQSGIASSTSIMNDKLLQLLARKAVTYRSSWQQLGVQAPTAQYLYVATFRK